MKVLFQFVLGSPAEAALLPTDVQQGGGTASEAEGLAEHTLLRQYFRIIVVLRLLDKSCLLIKVVY